MVLQWEDGSGCEEKRFELGWMQRIIRMLSSCLL
jgi:hypothetical protein